MFLWVLTVGYFLLISYPSDKLEWYDAPLYPFLSLIIGIFLSFLADKIRNTPFTRGSILAGKLIPLFLIAALFSLPYYQSVKGAFKTDEIVNAWDTTQTDKFRIAGAYMKHLKEENPSIHSYTVLQETPFDPEHLDQIKFYQRTYQVMDDYSIQLSHHPGEINTVLPVMACEKVMQDSLESAYNYDVMDTWKGCKLYSIKSTRSAAFIQ